MGMKETSPQDGTEKYFVDKYQPFGASISCSHCQKVSNALAYAVVTTTAKALLNHLHDSFFADKTGGTCVV